MRLWRATDAESPRPDRGSCWTETREEAAYYLNGRTLGFGGDTLYVLETDTDAVLYLSDDPWPAVADAVGIDRDDYDDGESDADLLAALVSVFAAHGYAWVVYHDHDLRGPGARTWLYCGDEPLDASRPD